MANQYTNNPGESKKDQTFAFVRANPGCTARQLGEAIGVQTKTACMYLSRLNHDRRISGYRAAKGEKLQWSIIEEDDGECDYEPVRIVRQQWEPHHFRDPLDAAFFGPAQRMAA